MDAYQKALKSAEKELAEIEGIQQSLAMRKLQLRQTVAALRAIKSGAMPDISALSLSDAIRMVFNAAHDNEPFTAPEIRLKIEEFGFDTSKFKNPLASIHTAMERMVESDEIGAIEVDGISELDAVGKKIRKKKKFEKGKRLKPLPAVRQSPYTDRDKK
ncbi:MAG: hypothetical protein A3F68_07010 [Acidobacteria bacterium RIFCSPLOWO2_12_FULL_54_10]|nr:MAG: hypothetical protein A3F68_07010 [Acidobacteria bacterium RIFCSPLOWO2_12_FULL_54_10]